MFKLVALFAVVALAAAEPAVVSPLAYSAGAYPYTAAAWPYSAGAYPYNAYSSVYPGYVSPYNAAYSDYVSPYTYPYNYGLRSGIATQAPGAPALALDPVSKVPLDTPEVAAAKVAHYQAKALELSGVHAIKKRSVVAPLAYSGYNAYNTLPAVGAYPYSAAWASPYSSAYSYPAYNTGYGYNNVFNYPHY